MKFRKLGEIFIKYRIRRGRGAVFTSEVSGLISELQQAGIIFLLIDKYFHVLPPLWVAPLFWFAKISFEYLAGWYDEVKLKWWPAENNYVMANVNPFLADMKKDITDIKNYVLPETKK